MCVWYVCVCACTLILLCSAILSFEDVLLTVSECDGTVNIPVLRVGTINTKLIIPVNVTELTARNGL